MATKKTMRAKAKRVAKTTKKVAKAAKKATKKVVKAKKAEAATTLERFTSAIKRALHIPPAEPRKNAKATKKAKTTRKRAPKR